MWLSDLSIKRPVFITMVVLAISVVGGLLYTRMPVDLFPNIAIPVIAVRTVYPGTTPQEVETLLAKPIEEAVSSLNHVDAVHSTSQESVSIVVIEYSLDYPIKDAADDVRQKLASIRNDLPADAKDPEVLRFDPAATPILTFAIADRRGQMSPDQLRTLMDDKLVPRIERVPGVGTVDVTGGLVRQVHVDLNLDRLRAQGLGVQQVIAAVKGENLNVPGGRLTEGGREQLLRTLGEFQSLDEIASVPLATPRGGTIYLRDVAAISEGFEDQTARSRLNGKESVVASIQKQSGTNTVRVAEAVKAELKRIQAERPEVEIAIATDQSTFTKEATLDVLVSLLMGALLAAVVVFAFFRDVRNTLVTVAGLPVIVLGTFIAMDVAGFTINMITLLGLSISIGMLIDDAIVVRENIFRHMEAGEEPKEAASRGTAEIALAVLATTMTIVAVFVPIAFTPGIAGRFLRDFGLTVALAVLISLFEAFTFAPMLSAYFFRRVALTPGPSPASRERGAEGGLRGGTYGRVESGYRAALRWSLRHRLVVVLVAILALAGSLAMFPLLGRSFVSDFDRGELSVSLEMPPGTTLDEMDRVTAEVEEMLRRQPETQEVFSIVGSTGGSTSPEQASIKVELKGRGMIDSLQNRIRPELEALPGVKYAIDLQANTIVGMMLPQMASVRSRPFQLSVQGSNFADLDAASARVAEMLQRIPGVVDVDRSLRPGRPEVQVQVDRTRAADLGISTAQIGSTVRALVNGEAATKYTQGDKELDVLVRLRPEDRERTDDIAQLPLLTPRGAQVPLSSVARLTLGTGPAQIERKDRQREVLVGAGYMGRELGEITNDANAALASLPLPPGVTAQVTGQTKYMEEAFSNLALAFGLAVLFIYVVLASQFESFAHPFTIMLALPLSFVGALASLLLAGKSLDMVGLIGIILLMGLVTKNSILLVDFTNAMRARGHSIQEAILRAGPIRLRPIMMTTLSMIFGMLPIALGYGAGAEIRMPMAIGVIGGLTTSTLLTLIVVPVVYTLVDDLSRRLTGRRGETAAAETEPAVAGGGREPAG